MEFAVAESTSGPAGDAAGELGADDAAGEVGEHPIQANYEKAARREDGSLRLIRPYRRPSANGRPRASSRPSSGGGRVKHYNPTTRNQELQAKQWTTLVNKPNRNQHLAWSQEARFYLIVSWYCCVLLLFALSSVVYSVRFPMTRRGLLNPAESYAGYKVLP